MLAKESLATMANIDKIHTILANVHQRKAQIVKDKQEGFIRGKLLSLQNYRLEIQTEIENRISDLERSDIDQLKVQQGDLQQKRGQLKATVNHSYDELRFKNRVELSKALKQIVSNEMRAHFELEQTARQTRTATRTVIKKVEKQGIIPAVKRFFGSESYEEYSENEPYTYDYILSPQIKSTVRAVRNKLQIELNQYILDNQVVWRKSLYTNIISDVRKVMNDNIDISLLTNAIRKAVDMMPEKKFNLASIPDEIIEVSGELRDNDCFSFMAFVSDYMDSLQEMLNNDIDNYLNIVEKKLSRMDLTNELVKNLDNPIKELIKQIKDKEQNLYLYNKLLKEIRGIN